MSAPPDDFAELFAYAWPRLFRSAYAITGDRQLAEDALQTAFAQGYAAWWRVRRADDPMAYLRKMVVNASLAQRRRGWSRREAPSDALPDVPAPARPLDDAIAGRTTMWDAVQLLPPRQRAVVVLRYYEDLTEAEIADALGIRPGTVKSQSSAALRALRARLGDPVSRGGER